MFEEMPYGIEVREDLINICGVKLANKIVSNINILDSMDVNIESIKVMFSVTLVYDNDIVKHNIINELMFINYSVMKELDIVVNKDMTIGYEETYAVILAVYRMLLIYDMDDGVSDILEDPELEDNEKLAILMYNFNPELDQSFLLGFIEDVNPVFLLNIKENLKNIENYNISIDDEIKLDVDKVMQYVKYIDESDLRGTVDLLTSNANVLSILDSVETYIDVVKRVKILSSLETEPLNKYSLLKKEIVNLLLAGSNMDNETEYLHRVIMLLVNNTDYKENIITQDVVDIDNELIKIGIKEEFKKCFKN